MLVLNIVWAVTKCRTPCPCKFLSLTMELWLEEVICATNFCCNKFLKYMNKELVLIESLVLWIVVVVIATVVGSVVNLLTVFFLNLGQTDRHTHGSVYRVAPQLKIKKKPVSNQAKSMALSLAQLSPSLFYLYSFIVQTWCRFRQMS